MTEPVRVMRFASGPNVKPVNVTDPGWTSGCAGCAMLAECEETINTQLERIAWLQQRLDDVEADNRHLRNRLEKGK